jgi:DNA-directed RNA polymerase beta subunit
MIQKLYALVAGECATDNPDSPQHQEVLLGGHLYLSYMKEKLADWLQSIVLQIRTDLRRTPNLVDFLDSKFLFVLQMSSSLKDGGSVSLTKTFRLLFYYAHQLLHFRKIPRQSLHQSQCRYWSQNGVLPRHR